MTATKELFEKLASDKEFAGKFAESVRAKRETGAKDYYETIIPAAAEFGYEVDKDELDRIVKEQNENLSEEELGKVAGGTSCAGTLAMTFITVISFGALSGATIAASRGEL